MDNMKQIDIDEKSALLPNRHGQTKRTFLKPTTFIRAMAIAGLLAGCFEKLVHGSVFAITAYVNDIKSTFNYTQTEIELISTASNIGRGLAVFPGMFFDKFGPRISCTVGMTVTSGSYLLIWSATKSIEFYKSASTLLALYFLLSGFGSMFAFIASQNTSIANFASKRRGLILGVHCAFLSLGSILSSQVYYGLFTLPYSEGSYGMEYNFPAFMVLEAVLFGIANFLCILFTGWYSNDTSKKSENPEFDLAKQHNITLTVSDGTIKESSTSEVVIKRTFWQVLKNPEYNIYLYTFGLLACADNIMLANLTISTKSLNLTDYDVYIVPVYFASSLLTNITMGTVLHYVETQRIRFLILQAIVAIIGFVLYITFGNIPGVFFVGSSMMGIALGIGWVVVPLEISHKFGIQQMGRNWGFFRVAQTILNFPVLFIFGVLYEMFIEGGSIYCYGIDCTRYGFVFLLSMAGIALCALVIKYIRSR